jgi:hypothetical protein
MLGCRLPEFSNGNIFYLPQNTSVENKCVVKITGLDKAMT